MNCANHPEIPAVSFCRDCGKALCEECQRPAFNTVYCQEHVPQEAGPIFGAATAGVSTAGAATGGEAAGVNAEMPPPPPPPAAGPSIPAGSNPWTAPPPRAAQPGASPGLAFVLGLLPGVGAVYNGQYAKGLIHAVVFGLLVSINTSGAAGDMEPLFGLMTVVWMFYMAFEAYHTASRRQRGEAVDEFSSLLPLQRRTGASGLPVGPVALIALGVVFLLNTLELVRLRDILRFWPVFLIGLGVYMLWVRVTGRDGVEEGSGHERSI